MKATSKVFIDVTDDGRKIYKRYSAIGKTVDTALAHLLKKIKKDIAEGGTVVLEWDTTIITKPALVINIKLNKCYTTVGSTINWE